MFTRGLVEHQYCPNMQPHVNTPGAFTTRQASGPNNNKHITVVMPIARPNSSPSPTGAPLYLAGTMGGGSHRPNGVFGHGGTLPWAPSRPRVEMDPSDSSTWQRAYRFT